ncbi:hypothetical protein [Siminovitchia terrae]|uniref:hypothetical protein n=1 Tax=Siminovitchia terrae TaxID=1914933 RepID=UPI0028B1E89E|nr:hypothetical protein [Siminovitchia terrae]
MVKIKERFPLMGTSFLGIVSLFNLFSGNEVLVASISLGLFLLVLFLYFLTKNINVED